MQELLTPSDRVTKNNRKGNKGGDRGRRGGGRGGRGRGRGRGGENGRSGLNNVLVCACAALLAFSSIPLIVLFFSMWGTVFCLLLSACAPLVRYWRVLFGWSREEGGCRLAEAAALSPALSTRNLPGIVVDRRHGHTSYEMAGPHPAFVAFVAVCSSKESVGAS